MDNKTKKFINKANIKHNNKYIYIDSVYTRAIDKIKIKCPLHGDFYQTPHDHLSGSGCNECGRQRAKEKMSTSINIFIKSANIIHENKYEYHFSENILFISIKDKITIYCPKHGNFDQIASTHLIGSGCSKCGYESLSYTHDEFVNKSNIIHNNKYVYISEYINCHSKVNIKCPIHGEFTQKAYQHLQGKGCNACANIIRVEGLKTNENSFTKSGYKSIAKDRNCIFYIIQCFNENENFYKIGITVNKNVKKRYPSKKTMPYNYNILNEISGNAEYIWGLENILKKNLKNKYIPLIKFAGSLRECYIDYNEILIELDKIKT